MRKTTIRNGLKQAGDVNLVGRIHSYLEQIAAINFQCEETNYCRPLLELAAVSVSASKDKAAVIKSEILPRQRTKKKYINVRIYLHTSYDEVYYFMFLISIYVFNFKDGEGGYTLTHDEKGEIINTTVVNEEPAVKQRSYLKKPSIRLVYCRPFTDEYPVSIITYNYCYLYYNPGIFLAKILNKLGHKHLNPNGPPRTHAPHRSDGSHWWLLVVCCQKTCYKAIHSLQKYRIIADTLRHVPDITSKSSGNLA